VFYLLEVIGGRLTTRKPTLESSMFSFKGALVILFYIASLRAAYWNDIIARFFDYLTCFDMADYC